MLNKMTDILIGQVKTKEAHLNFRFFDRYNIVFLSLYIYIYC